MWNSKVFFFSLFPMTLTYNTHRIEISVKLWHSHIIFHSLLLDTNLIVTIQFIIQRHCNIVRWKVNIWSTVKLLLLYEYNFQFWFPLFWSYASLMRHYLMKCAYSAHISMNQWWFQPLVVLLLLNCTSREYCWSSFVVFLHSLEIYI